MAQIPDELSYPVDGKKARPLITLFLLIIGSASLSAGHSAYSEHDPIYYGFALFLIVVFVLFLVVYVIVKKITGNIVLRYDGVVSPSSILYTTPKFTLYRDIISTELKPLTTKFSPGGKVSLLTAKLTKGRLEFVESFFANPEAFQNFAAELQMRVEAAKA